MDAPDGQFTEEAIAHPVSHAPFFERCDWLGFAITAAVTLAVYLFTLPPEITLGNEGMMATAGFYAGNGMPPGYPLWCIYAWLFTRLLPLSNVAWRIEVSSAVAAAIASAIAALMVSRSGKTFLERMRGADGSEGREEKPIRTAAGCVAGMAFAFDSAVWQPALKVDMWPLTLALFAIVLCLLLRWHHSPEKRRYLYAATLCYGLLLANSQSLIMAAIGIATMALMANPAWGRDVFASTALLTAFVAALPNSNNLVQTDQLRHTCEWISGLSLLVAIILGVKSRAMFTNWRGIIVCGLLLTLGLMPYFLLPIVGMTTPPANWGYARTAEGFWHMLSRGQYEKPNFTDSFDRLWSQLNVYTIAVGRDFGITYVILALVPFFCFRRLSGLDLRWLLGLVGMFLCLSLFWLMALNPSDDRLSVEMHAIYFTPSHFILALRAGYGLLILGRIATRSKSNASTSA